MSRKLWTASRRSRRRSSLAMSGRVTRSRYRAIGATRWPARDGPANAARTPPSTRVPGLDGRREALDDLADLGVGDDERRRHDDGVLHRPGPRRVHPHVALQRLPDDRVAAAAQFHTEEEPAATDVHDGR